MQSRSLRGSRLNLDAMPLKPDAVGGASGAADCRHADDCFSDDAAVSLGRYGPIAGLSASHGTRRRGFCPRPALPPPQTGPGNYLTIITGTSANWLT
jgi:hypothetical protein